MGLATANAEAKLAWDVPIRLTAALPTLWADLHVFGHMSFERAFDFWLGLGQVQPRLRQILNVPFVRLAQVGRAQKAVPGVVIVVARDVVNLTGGVLLRSLA